ncbi:EAL domain-containing protein, partial [Vibrio parahaemolyticus]|nr:EAL domain-containing protein [Vibrio parahaemolyticus]
MFTVEYSEGGRTTIRSERSYVTLEFLLQPIYFPKNGQTVYYEALSSVISDSGEHLNSEAFFETINDEFIKTVLLLQMEHFSQSNSISQDILLNVNLSSLKDDDFIESIIKRNKSNKYHIEVNEIDTPVRDVKILKNIKRLQKSGIYIILDDYYHENEIAHLSLGVIDWDYIKIDKSFLLYNSGNDDCLKALIFVISPYCKNGLIIEGVETYFQNEFVKKYNLLAQGYYYSRPKNIFKENRNHKKVLQMN